MGTFSVKMRVWNPAKPGDVEELDAYVDTGAAFSWISRDRLTRLGVVSSRRMGFRTIEGRLLERDMATVYVSTDKYSVPDVVVMAEVGEMEVMGAHTIEGLAMAADPVQKKLVPTVMLALAAERPDKKLMGLCRICN
jgi:predicted aspartyl protease